MITKFDSSYYGTADMENLGYKGTPINERRYSQEELAEGAAQGRGTTPNAWTSAATTRSGWPSTISSPKARN